MDGSLLTVARDDGRTIEVAVAGPHDAPALVFHHGSPGAAVLLGAVREAALTRGLRLVTWSRPGYGGSSRLPDRRVVDDVADAEAVLDHLGVGHCLVAGWSGGGPYALATAARLPDRVEAVLCLAGVAPYDADGLDWFDGMGAANLDEFHAAERGEAALREGLDPELETLVDITGPELAARLPSLLSPADREALVGSFADDLAAGMRRAVAAGLDGWIDDDLAFVRPWGFGLDEVTAPVLVWHGTTDLMVPTDHGRWLGHQVPHARTRIVDGAGHLLVADHFPEALDELMALTRPE